MTGTGYGDAHRLRPGARPAVPQIGNQAVGCQIATQLRLAGYQADSGIPVVLLSYSGGASPPARSTNCTRSYAPRSC
ncbi:hypothetical protein ACWC9U_34335 [Streptomyces sp. 900116325]